MRTGISTGCLYPMETEKALKLLVDNGFDNLEIFFNTFSELETDYLLRLRQIADSKGVSVSSVHPFISSFESYLLFSGYERRFEDGLNLYEMFFRCASLMGADKVVLHGMRDAFSSIGENEYFRRFSLLYERGRRYGVDLLQENVDKYYSNRPTVLRNMKKTIPQSSGFVLDIKQAIRGGVDPVELVLIMGDKLRHIHISDVTAGGGCVLPGQGCYDYEALFSALRNIEYDGDIIIEVYSGCFENIRELIKAREFIEKYI